MLPADARLLGVPALSQWAVCIYVVWRLADDPVGPFHFVVVLPSDNHITDTVAITMDLLDLHAAPSTSMDAAASAHAHIEHPQCE